MISRLVRFLAAVSGVMLVVCLVCRLWQEAVSMPVDSASLAAIATLASLVVLVMTIYFLPTIVASRRDIAVGTATILFVNLLLGWTVLGWVVCLLWAALGQSRQQVAFFRQAASTN